MLMSLPIYRKQFLYNEQVLPSGNHGFIVLRASVLSTGVRDIVWDREKCKCEIKLIYL